MLGVILAGLIMGAASAGLWGIICSIQLTGLQEKVYEVYLITNKLIYFFFMP